MSHSSGEIVKFVFIQCLCLCLCLQNSRKLVRAKSTNPGTCPIYVRTKAYPSRTFIFPPISSWFGHFADLTMPTGRSLVWSYPTLWSCLLENGARWTFAIERIIKSIRALRSHVQQVVVKTQFFLQRLPPWPAGTIGIDWQLVTISSYPLAMYAINMQSLLGLSTLDPRLSYALELYPTVWRVCTMLFASCVMYWLCLVHALPL